MIQPFPLVKKAGDFEKGFNLETNETVIFHVHNAAVCSVQIVTDSTTCVIKVQRSNDGSHPRDLETAQTITGSGMTDAIDCMGFTYLHCTCTTADTGKTANLYPIGKAST